jgi:F-type H+-transporting ATPase subunit epsilon
MATLDVRVVSPEQVLWRGEATTLIARSVEGGLGILPRHAPLLAALDVGVVTVRPVDGEEILLVADGGFLSVSPTGEDGVTHVTVLAESALLSGDIDVAAARQALADAEAMDSEDPAAKRAVKAAKARLEAAGVA